MVTLHRGVPVATRSRRGRPPLYGRDLRVTAGQGLVLALLLVPVLVWSAWQGLPPDRLSNSELTGIRLLPGPACIAIAADLSGSMAGVAQQRRAAMDTLLPWLRKNLQSRDQVALAAFTDHAALVLPATSIDQLPAIPPSDPDLPGDSTAAIPAVALLGEAFRGRGCGATELVIITDGKFGDSPAELLEAIAQAGITRTLVFNPNGRERPMPLDDVKLAGIRVLPIRNADEQALAYGRAVADLTGQKLART